MHACIAEMHGVQKNARNGRTSLMGIRKDFRHFAEVDFPIAVVSKHAVREKATPKAHPSMLHLWWAGRYGWHLAEGAT
ncbi:MAG: hypothetical protein A3G24_15525 [Betaproteobacteria bacterium RIFCSPLOWO2_12_FULL_62_13]|nr:MAG: hypothetical protein A3G24_15525 [Betaproteobacteria bacterium RIFCSPLOWO2_12_FULL_62_13]